MLPPSKNAPGYFDEAAARRITRADDEKLEPRMICAAKHIRAVCSSREGQSAFFEKAASILASRIETQINPGELPDLVVSLHAMAGKASSEPFERAAAAVVANPRGLSALEPTLGRLGGKLREENAKEIAAILESKIAGAKDAQSRQLLEEALAHLPVHSRPASDLFNPLCPESEWEELARRRCTPSRARLPQASNPISHNLGPTTMMETTDRLKEPPLDFPPTQRRTVRGSRPAYSGNTTSSGARFPGRYRSDCDGRVDAALFAERSLANLTSKISR